MYRNNLPHTHRCLPSTTPITAFSGLGWAEPLSSCTLLHSGECGSAAAAAAFGAPEGTSRACRASPGKSKPAPPACGRPSSCPQSGLGGCVQSVVKCSFTLSLLRKEKPGRGDPPTAAILGHSPSVWPITQPASVKLLSSLLECSFSSNVSL